MKPFVNYHVIRFGTNDKGFWNIPEWHKNREGAMLDYIKAQFEPDCDGAVLIISNYADWKIAAHFGAKNYTVIPENYNIFRVAKNENCQ